MATPEQAPLPARSSGPGRLAVAALLVAIAAGAPTGAVVWIANNSGLPAWGILALLGASAVLAGILIFRWVVRGVLAPPEPVIALPLVAPPARNPGAPAAPTPAGPPARRDEADVRQESQQLMGKVYEAMAARAAREGREAPSPANLRLADAVQGGDLDSLRIAIAEGATLDTFTFADPTAKLLAPAICHAVSAGHHAVVQLLLQSGANPNAEATLRSETSDEEIATLHVACARGDFAMVSLLLQAGADPNATWKKWTTEGESSAPCLATAIGASADPDARLAIVDALLKRGADANAIVRWRDQGSWWEAPLLSLTTVDARLGALLRRHGAQDGK
jgi:hypothetical protein